MTPDATSALHVHGEASATGGAEPAAGVAWERHRQVHAIGRLFVVLTCATVWIPWSIQIGGLNLRLSQIALPFVILVLWQDRPRLVIRRSTVPVAACAILYVGSLAFWTALNPSIAELQPFGRVGLHALNLMHMVVAYMLVVRTKSLLPFLRTFVTSVAVFDLGFVVLAVGVAAGVLPSFGIIEESLQPVFDQVAGVAAETVRRIESGGITAGCLSAGALGALLALRTRTRPPGTLYTAVVGMALGAGLVVGFSRQAVLSLAAAVLVVVFGVGLAGRVKPLLRLTGWLALLAAGSLVIVLVVPGLRQYLDAFAGRALLLFSERAYSAGTVSDRISMWGLMLREVAQNPFVGHGQDTYMRYYPADFGGGSHNFFIEVLHAGGAVALVALLGLHLAALARGWRAVSRSRRRRDQRALVLAVAASVAAVVFAAMTNLIYWNPSYWILLGWLLAVRVPTEPRGGRDGRASPPALQPAG